MTKEIDRMASIEVSGEESAVTAQVTPQEFVFVRKREIKDERFQTAQIGFFKDALIRFSRNKASIVAFSVICVIIFLALFGPSMTGYGFNDQRVDRVNLPPRIPYLEKLGIANGTRLLLNRRLDGLSDTSRYPEGSIVEVRNRRTMSGVEMADVVVDYYLLAGAKDEYHWFGTDYLGRDLMTRLFRGSRISLTIAFVSVFVNIIIGIVYGSIAGYYGGKVDLIMMRIVEVIAGLPHIVVVTMFILLFGTGLLSIILALVVRGWISTARLIRAQFYRFKGREYVLAAKTVGVPDILLIFRHILPNSLGPIITRAMIAVPGAIFSESFLAFIGLGIQAPEPSIGVLLSDGQKTLLQYPFQVFFPALLISLLMVSFNLFANGLRDALDPTMRGEG
jgi:oligopeptide transport system permease protein